MMSACQACRTVSLIRCGERAHGRTLCGLRVGEGADCDQQQLPLLREGTRPFTALASKKWGWIVLRSGNGPTVGAI